MNPESSIFLRPVHKLSMTPWPVHRFTRAQSAILKAQSKMPPSFIAHFNKWKGDEVVLLVVDHQVVKWLISQFERLAAKVRLGPGRHNLFSGTKILSNQTDPLLRVELNQKLGR